VRVTFARNKLYRLPFRDKRQHSIPVEAQRERTGMAQTKIGSFAEAWANILVGFSVNYTANLLIFPLFGFHISLEANFLMGLIYTAISLVRSYVLRRYFNGLKFGNAPEVAK
jgi:hypothetical protein